VIRPALTLSAPRARLNGSGRASHTASSQNIRQAGSQAYANRERRLPPRSPARARSAHRSGRERSSHHGVEKRIAAHACRRFERKNGGFWRAQFCTELARSERFELPTLGFEVRCSIQLSYERVRPFRWVSRTPNFLGIVRGRPPKSISTPRLPELAGKSYGMGRAGQYADRRTATASRSELRVA
jgi:hypothetical protein